MTVRNMLEAPEGLWLPGSSSAPSTNGFSNIQVASTLTFWAFTSPLHFVSVTALSMCRRVKPISRSGAAMGGGGGELDRRLSLHKLSSESDENRFRDLVLDGILGLLPGNIFHSYLTTCS